MPQAHRAMRPKINPLRICSFSRARAENKLGRWSQGRGTPHEEALRRRQLRALDRGPLFHEASDFLARNPSPLISRHDAARPTLYEFDPRRAEPHHDSKRATFRSPALADVSSTSRYHSCLPQDLRNVLFGQAPGIALFSKFHLTYYSNRPKVASQRAPCDRVVFAAHRFTLWFFTARAAKQPLNLVFKVVFA